MNHKKEKIYLISLKCTDIFLINLTSFFCTISGVFAMIPILVILTTFGEKEDKIELRDFFVQIKKQFISALKFTFLVGMVALFFAIDIFILRNIIPPNLFFVITGMEVAIFISLISIWLTNYENQCKKGNNLRIMDFFVLKNFSVEDFINNIIFIIFCLTIYFVSYLLPIIFFLFYVILIRECAVISKKVCKDRN